MKTEKIYIAGHQGMMGLALCQELLNQGYRNLVTCPKGELDLTDQSAVLSFLEQVQPDVVFIPSEINGLLSAYAMLSADLIYQNLMIQASLIHGSWRAGVKKLFFIAGDYVYPHVSPSPVPEEALLTGSLAPEIETLALAKISGMKMLEAYNRQYATSYMSLIHSHIYGSGPHLQSENSFGVLSIMQQIHLAKLKQLKKVEIITNSSAYDLLYVDDFAKACVYLLENPCSSMMLNVGGSHLISMQDLSQAIAELVGYRGEIELLNSKEIDKPQCLAVEKINHHGWSASISFKQGLKLAYASCLEQGIFVDNEIKEIINES